MSEKSKNAVWTTRRHAMVGMISLSGAALAGCQVTNSRLVASATSLPAQNANTQALTLSPVAARFGVTPISYKARRDGEHLVPTVYMSGIASEFHRQVVEFKQDYKPGTIVVDNASRYLFLVLPNRHALRYGISVGAEGMTWRGKGTIYRRAHWPIWTPTPSMISRDSNLRRYAGGMAGGSTNPLGARALYLMTAGRDQGYRIHGTPNWRSIGHYASSGCIRMINHDIIDLYERVPVGTTVITV